MTEPKRYTIHGTNKAEAETKTEIDKDGQWIFDPDHKIDINGWIKFKDRTPEHEGWYLVYYKNALNWQSAEWRKNADGNLNWMKPGSAGYHSLYDPDYWMKVEIPLKGI